MSEASSPPPNLIDRLRRIAMRLGAGEALDQDDGLWLAGEIAIYLSGGPPRWAHGARNDAIRAAADFFEGGTADRVAAVTAALRHHGRRWRVTDRHRSTMPIEYSGKIEEQLYAAYAATDGKVPTSLRHVRRILSGWTPKALGAGAPRVTPKNPRVSRLFAHLEGHPRSRITRR